MSATFLATLDAALRADDPPALRALLDAGPLPVLSSPLVAQATSMKASRCVVLLLELGHPAAATRVDGLCALHLVRDPKTARLLLTAGVPVDAPSPSGTPLHMAAANEGAPVIKVLLDAGADPDALQSDNRTPLAVACSLGRTAAVKALLARPPATATCFNLLAEYAQRGLQKKDIAVLSALLEHLPADLEPNPGFDNALHIAAGAGSPEAVERLLAAGAAVDRPDREGRSPAFLALRSTYLGGTRGPRYIAAFRLLVAAGADLDRPCGDTTPRALAAKYGVELS